MVDGRWEGGVGGAVDAVTAAALVVVAVAAVTVVAVATVCGETASVTCFGKDLLMLCFFTMS